MAWDAGSIDSRLDVDTSPFHRGLEEAKAEAREFADKRYTTTVDINTKRSQDELSAVESRLHSIESSMDRIAKKGGGGGRGGFLSRFAGANIPNPSGMALGLGAALPLLSPFGALAGGVAGGAVSASATGLLGLGAFGIAAKQNIATLTKTQDAYEKLQAKIANTPQSVTSQNTTRPASASQIQLAQLRLATAQAATHPNAVRIASAEASLAALQARGGTTSTTKANPAYQKLLKQEADLLKGLDPLQRQAIKNVDGLQDAWKGYKKALEPQSFKLLADGAKIATTGLGYLLPTAKAVGDEVDNLAKKAERSLAAPFWHQFFGDFLPKEAVKSVDTLGRSLGNFLTGGAHLIQGFAPLAHDLDGGLLSLSGKFEKWTEGAGPGKFVAWAEKNGPPAAKALEALAKAVGGLAVGFAPLGGIELRLLTPVLTAVGDLSKAHPKTIEAVGAALLVVGGGLKAINLAQGAAGVLSKIPGLKGIGGGGGSGGGGVLGGLAGRGSSPVNPLYVFVVDQAGGGGLPVPGGKKLPGSGKLAPLARLSIPLTAAYLATQGGDQAPGQNSIYSNLRGGPNSPNTKAAQALYQVLGPKAAEPFINRSGALPELNIANAVSQVATSGSGGQQAQLAALARQYPAIAGALKEVNRQEGVLNQYLAVNTGLAAANARAVDDQNAALRRELSTLGSLPGYLTAAAQAAQTGGFVIGKSLSDGITIGIAQGADKVALESVKVVKGALHASRTTAQLGSPSKITTQYGRWIAEGLAVGFTGYQGELLKAFTGTTATALGRLGGQLSTAATQYRTDLQGRADLKASIAGGIMGSASIGNATLSNTGGATVGGFLAGQVRMDTRFARDVATLRKRGLDPRLLQQIVDAGPQQGSILAQQILSGSQASIRGLNAQERTLGSLSQSIGGTVANANFAGPLARDQRALEKAAVALERLVTKKLDLSPHAAVLMERAFEQAIRKAFPSLNLKQLDAALGLKIVAG